MRIRTEILQMSAVAMAFAVAAAAVSPAAAAGYGTSATARTHRPVYVLPTKVCFWKLNNGTPFGISGQCAVGQATPVGAPCTCTRTVEHNVTSHPGTVIEIPAPGTPSPIH